MDTPEDLRRRASIVRFNAEANKDPRRQTAWFAALKPKVQNGWITALEKHAARLERAAARAERRANRKR